MGSDSASFFVNVFLFFDESIWLKSNRNTKYGVARKTENIFLFYDDLIASNDGNKFENHYNKIYPPRLISKMVNTSATETSFLDAHLYMSKSQIQTSLFDKRDSCNFSIVIFPYK